MWVLGIEPSPLEEQPMLLTSESSLRPKTLKFLLFAASQSQIWLWAQGNYGGPDAQVA